MNPDTNAEHFLSLPMAPSALTVREALFRHNRERPDDRFLSFARGRLADEVHWTFGEVFAESWRVAEALIAAGCQPGDRLMLVYPNSPEYIFALFACQLAGFVAVPVYPPGNVKHMNRLRKIIASSSARFVLAKSDEIPRVRQLLDSLVAQRVIEAVICTDAANGPVVGTAFELPQHDRLCLLQYTSGSTGDPKGVMVTERAMRENAINQHVAMDGGRRGPGVTWLPLYHDMGLIGSLFQSVIWGYPLVCFMSYMFVQRPHLWLQLISRHKAVRSGAPNFAFQFCLDRVDPSQMDGVDLSSWRLAFCGAEPIRKSTLAAFAEKFAPYGFDARAFMACYGLAEATLLVSSAPPFSGITSQSLSRTGLTVGNFDQVPAGSDGSFDVVDCGVPANSLQVAIVDPQTLQVCPPGKIGEIWVAGPSIADGYWQSDISDAVFKAQRADAPDAGPYLRTGDLGAMQDGRLFVTGRLKEVIIINGRNFYPNDIELCLEESHSEIEKNNSVATTISGDKGESLSIFAQLNRRAVRDCDFDDVCRGISRSVSSTFGITPGRIVLLMPGEMPKSTSGKLQRVSLNHRFEQGALKTAHVHDLDGGLS